MYMHAATVYACICICIFNCGMYKYMHVAQEELDLQQGCALDLFAVICCKASLLVGHKTTDLTLSTQCCNRRSLAAGLDKDLGTEGAGGPTSSSKRRAIAIAVATWQRNRGRTALTGLCARPPVAERDPGKLSTCIHTGKKAVGSRQ